jgi:hypothetical protein
VAPDNGEAVKIQQGGHTAAVLIHPADENTKGKPVDSVNSVQRKDLGQADMLSVPDMICLVQCISDLLTACTGTKPATKARVTISSRPEGANSPRKRPSGGDVVSTATEGGGERGNEDSNHRDDGADEGDDDDDENGRTYKRKRVPGTEEKLACPFYKHDPGKYGSSRACCGPGWSAVHRIK